jgi:hypothetical protein
VAQSSSWKLCARRTRPTASRSPSSTPGSRIRTPKLSVSAVASERSYLILGSSRQSPKCAPSKNRRHGSNAERSHESRGNVQPLTVSRDLSTPLGPISNFALDGGVYAGCHDSRISSMRNRRARRTFFTRPWLGMQPGGSPSSGCVPITGVRIGRTTPSTSHANWASASPSRSPFPPDLRQDQTLYRLGADRVGLRHRVRPLRPTSRCFTDMLRLQRLSPTSQRSQRHATASRLPIAV